MTRRTTKMMTLAAAAALGLSACTIPVALSQTTNTLGGSAYLQVHFKVAIAHGGASAAAEAKLLEGLTFDVNVASVNGAPIARALNKLNQELIVWNGSQRVATVIDHKSNLYVNVNIAALAHLPGVAIPANALTTTNLLLGNRWIEIPFDLIAHDAATSRHLTITRSTAVSTELRAVNALVAVLANMPTTTTATGFEQSGTLASLDKALATLVPSTSTSTTPVPGTYKIAVTMAGTSATSAVATVVTPNGTAGDARVTMTATFAHQSVHVSTPTYPLVITPALIKKFGGTNGGGVLGAGLLG